MRRLFVRVILARQDDQGVLQHNNEGDNMSGVLVLSTTYEEHDE